MDKVQKYSSFNECFCRSGSLKTVASEMAKHITGVSKSRRKTWAGYVPGMVEERNYRAFWSER
jgi:hypothetical protein